MDNARHIPNHYGYTLRNDEKPYAHKIPPGGNWRDLPEEDQRAFMKGSYKNGGGNAGHLRRLSWDEPALTITASVMAKANCQLHPGPIDKGGGRVIKNHNHMPLSESDNAIAKHVPDGGNWKDVPYDDLPERLKRIKDDIKKYKSPAFYKKAAWDEPAGTVSATMNPTHCQALAPSNQIERRDYMEYNATPTLPKNGLTVAELFCGGGLMAVGLKESGFSIVWANDFDKRAVEAYRHNIGDHVVLGDITKIDPNDIPDVDVIAGGPPCQDYSTAGKGEGEKGERGRLVWSYLNIIEKKQPKAFIFENVKGLVGKRHRKTFDALIEKFNEIGYVVSWRVINAWDYGVAQKRERVFIVGIRKDLGFSFVFPEPAPEDYRTQVLRDVIGDLPEPYANHDPKPLSDRVMNRLNEGGYDAYLKKHPPGVPDKPAPTLTAHLAKGAPDGLYFPNHENYPITDAQLEHSKKHKIGYNDSLDKPARIVRAKAENFLDLPNHDEKSFWMPKSEYTYDQANRVQSMDKPSNTIPAHHNSGQPIHPTQAPRRFTVRECLRIQSVPDWYVLPDDISLSAQYRIVGNGVASRVAWYLGRALAEQLNAHLQDEV